MLYRIGLCLAVSFAVVLPAGAEEFPLNEWVKVEEGGAGRRPFPALVYLPTEKCFLLALGNLGAWNDRKDFPFDEQVFSLGARQWANRFPLGKEAAWGPKVGVTTAPGFSGHGYVMKDREGNVRPGLLDGRFNAYTQYTLDTDRQKVIAYVHQHTLEYDVAARRWSEVTTTGNPITGRYALWWGSICYDPVNKEIVLFGGNNGPSEYNDPRTWLYSPATATWRRLPIEANRVSALRPSLRRVRLEADALYGASSNRYFLTETPQGAKRKLGDAGRALGERMSAAMEAVKNVSAASTGYAKVQCERALADLEAAAALQARLGDTVDTPALTVALALKRTLRWAEYSLMAEPPPRANSPMVFDPVSRKIVLFGGDRLDMLYADTWVYDPATRTWEERRPTLSPSPRAAHAFLLLPKAKKLVLIGGYKFDLKQVGGHYRQLPVQAWRYDVEANAWALIKDWGAPGRSAGDEPVPPRMLGRVGTQMIAAADDQDTVLALSQENRTVVTRLCRLDATKVDEAGTAKQGVPPGTVERRPGPWDPNWFLDGPAPDEAPFQARLKTLPANTWVVATGKGVRLPGRNRDWGTAVLDPDRDAIYRWSGGHSAHCGSDLPHYALRTNRYALKYPPSFPIEGIVGSGFQPSDEDFGGVPWNPGHSYHSYAYDPVVRKMLCCGVRGLIYIYDPDVGSWSRGPLPEGMSYGGSFYDLTLCSTPAGAVAWTQAGRLFRYDAQAKAWTPLKTTGAALPGTVCDAAGMCYDSKRDRLLFVTTARGKPFDGQVHSLDMTTLAARKLDPADAKGVTGFLRETCYDSANDLLVIGGTLPPDADGLRRTPVYDCANNRWLALKIGGAVNPNDPRKRGGGRNVSLGLMYDAKRGLVWAVDTYSRVYVLRIDLETADAVDPG